MHADHCFLLLPAHSKGQEAFVRIELLENVRPSIDLDIYGADWTIIDGCSYALRYEHIRSFMLGTLKMPVIDGGMGRILDFRHLRETKLTPEVKD